MKDDLAELYQSINSTVKLIATALKKRQIKLLRRKLVDAIERGREAAHSMAALSS